MTRALAAIILALALFAGWQTFRISVSRTMLVTEKLARETERVQLERAAREATEAELTRANKLANDTTKALNDAHQATEAARSDALRARRAGDSLRQYAAELAASADQAGGDCAPASPGPAARAPGHLLADMLSRIDGAAGELAEFADLAHAAGTACERIHGAAVTASGEAL